MNDVLYSYSLTSNNNKPILVKLLGNRNLLAVLPSINTFKFFILILQLWNSVESYRWQAIPPLPVSDKCAPAPVAGIPHCPQIQRVRNSWSCPKMRPGLLQLQIRRHCLLPQNFKNYDE